MTDDVDNDDDMKCILHCNDDDDATVTTTATDSDKHINVSNEDIWEDVASIVWHTPTPSISTPIIHVLYSLFKSDNLIPSKSASKRWIADDKVLLNNIVGKRGDMVVSGTVVRLRQRPLTWKNSTFYRDFTKLQSTDVKLDVVYEDDVMVCVVKPVGVVTICRGPCIARYLLPSLSPALTAVGPDALRKPRPCHRLDEPTSGLLLAAKTRSAMVGITNAFANREVQKTYRAVIIGRLEGSGEVSTPVDKKHAFTQWKSVSVTHSVLARDGFISTVLLYPRTGRKHQLRVHMASLGHPIIGDRRHTIRHDEQDYEHGLFLWAERITLNHPLSGLPLDLSLPEPQRFLDMRERQDQLWKEKACHDEGWNEVDGDEAINILVPKLQEKDGITLRPAVESDHVSIRDILTAEAEFCCDDSGLPLYGHYVSAALTYDLNDIEKRYPSDGFWIATVHDSENEREVLVGCMGIQLGTGSSGEKEAILLWMCVLPNYQRKGVATRFNNTAVCWARTQKVRRIVTRVPSSVKSANGLFRRLGYVLVAEKDDEFIPSCDNNIGAVGARVSTRISSYSFEFTGRKRKVDSTM